MSDLTGKEGWRIGGRKLKAWLRRLLVCAVGVAALYLILPPVLNAAARWLIRRDQLAQADVIIALGGDPRCWRERLAAELYHRGWARKVIVSGVPFAWGINTGEAARRYVVSLGVPEDDLLVFTDSWNTRIEARELIELMRRQGWRSAIVVTSTYHSRRALYTIERLQSGFAFYSAPVAAPAPGWQPEAWWTRRGDVWLTVREFISWGNTLAGGLQ